MLQHAAELGAAPSSVLLRCDRGHARRDRISPARPCLWNLRSSHGNMTIAPDLSAIREAQIKTAQLFR
jgi:hypothetical protein